MVLSTSSKAYAGAAMPNFTRIVHYKFIIIEAHKYFLLTHSCLFYYPRWPYLLFISIQWCSSMTIERCVTTHTDPSLARTLEEMSFTTSKRELLV